MPPLLSATVDALVTEEERTLIAELETRLADLNLTEGEHGASMVGDAAGGYGPLCPVAAIRFLRARDMDLAKAEAMVRESVEWRSSLTWTPTLYPAVPLTVITVNSSSGGK